MESFGEQMHRCEELDEEQLAEAFADLASSVLGRTAAPPVDEDAARKTDTAIAHILRYYGAAMVSVPADIEDFDERLEYLLRPTGIMYRKVRLDHQWHKDATGALLGYLKDGTPVALLPHGLSGYVYVDPVDGRKVKVGRRGAQELRADAICFYRPLPLKSLSVRDLGIFILHALEPSDYVLVALATLAATLIGLLPAWANQILFSQVIPSEKMGLVLPIAVLLIGVMLSQALISIAKSLVMARVTSKLEIQAEAATMARVISLEASFFREYAPGELASRASTVASLIQSIVNIALSTGLSSVFSLVYIFQIAAFAPSLTVPALLVILLDVGVSTAATFANMKYNRRQLEANAKLTGITTALLSGIQKIRLGGVERRAFARWSKSYADYARNVYDRPKLLKVAGTLSTVIGMLGTILIYWFAGTTGVSVANYMAFNVSYGLVVGAITSLAGVATTIAQIKPSMELVAPILKAVPETAENKLPVTHATGAIEVTDLVFSYGADLPSVLDGISLDIVAGEYLAIVGKTGCGKSTLIRLLLGFEKPTRGVVYYDGRNISDVDLRSLRRNIGVVMQDGKLFSGDIYSNITISAPWLSIDEAWEAAEMAGIAADIRKMPMGMHTIISEGSGSISGGQRQRLLIARAIAPKPRVLILDEATSALDNITQAQVSSALDELGCTRILIAHRLSTIRHCDRIVVIDGGKIVENGTYDQLIAADGIFADLVSRQRLEGEK